MSERRTFDVDIDVQSRTDREKFGIRAIVYNEEAQKILVHPSGVYIEGSVPVDRMTGHAAIDYSRGDEIGFYKVDILTNTAYDIFSSKKELLEFARMSPDWGLLHKSSVVETLPHIARHADLVREVSPSSVQELADCLALIRPAKIHLIESYKEDKERTRVKLYQRPKTGIYFKKSHAVSYAVMIVAVLNRRHAFGIEW